MPTFSCSLWIFSKFVKYLYPKKIYFELKWKYDFYRENLKKNYLRISPMKVKISKFFGKIDEISKKIVIEFYVPPLLKKYLKIMHFNPKHLPTSNANSKRPKYVPGLRVTPGAIKLFRSRLSFISVNICRFPKDSNERKLLCRYLLADLAEPRRACCINHRRIEDVMKRRLQES